MADQEIKIENCPMPGCGGQVSHVEDTWQISCPSCGYQLHIRRDSRELHITDIRQVERELIAAHNALATASARPKDVAGLEEAVNRAITEWPTISHNKEFRDHVTAAVRDFCDPETLRQRDALLELVKSLEWCDGANVTDGKDGTCYVRACPSCGGASPSRL